MDIEHEDGRFYIVLAGGNAELLYKIQGRTMSIYHTFVPESERGKGIAEKLAIAAFEFAEEEKLSVRPDCPYIVHFLEKNSEYKKFAVK